MSINLSEKIFLDKKEEITFIVERIITSEKEKVILVVPQNSILLSSNISINILHRKVVTSNKTVIIVTEDEYGMSVAQKAGFIVVPKVSQISSQLWDVAYDTKLKQKYELEEKQNALVDSITESHETSTSVDTEGNEETKENDLSANDIYEPQLTQKSQIEAEIQKYTKPRLGSKVVDVNGIKVYAGGNIKNLKQGGQTRDKIDPVINDEMSELEKRKFMDSYTGRDFTNTVNPNPKKGIFSRLFAKKIKDPDERLEGGVTKTRYNKRYIIMSLFGVVLLVLLFVTYYMAFIMNSVDIQLEVQKEDVTAVDRIIAMVESDVQEVDYESNTIPAKLIEESNLNTSRTGEATGSAKRGNKSKGSVTIFNTTAQQINLAIGTKLTSADNAKSYILTQAVTIEAADVDELGVSEAVFSSEVAIEAIDVGSEYNISDESPKTKFNIEGYSTNDVYANRFKAIEGGTSENYTIVSEDNVKALKEKIIPDLTKTGTDKLAKFVPSGYTIIQDSIKFEETKVQAFPKVGEESKDKTFTLTIEAKISAYIVKDSDLKDISAKILADSGSGRTVSSVEEIKIANVERGDNKVSFDVSFKGTVSKTLTEDNIKTTIAGKSLSDADKYFKGEEDITHYRISFSPNFLPEFLKKVPKDFSRITVKIK